MLSDPPIRRAVLSHAACLLSSLVLPMRAPVRAATNPELAGAAAAVPAAEARLVELSQGRRLSSWTAEERPVVDALVDELVMLGRQATWSRSALRGKWRLVYVQPGPQDVLYPGTERRLLFPDLQWNDKYQIVGLSYVINVGELAGPLLEVRAAGSLAEMDASPVLPSSTRSRGDPALPLAPIVGPRRFQAGLAEGALCGSITMGSRPSPSPSHSPSPSPAARSRPSPSLSPEQVAREGQHGPVVRPHVLSMGSAGVATARPEPRQTGRQGRQGPFVLGRTRLVLGCSTASHGTVSSSTPARAKRPGSFHPADMPNTQVRPLADTRRRLLRCPLRGASRSRQPERRRWRCAHGARARHELWRIPLKLVCAV